MLWEYGVNDMKPHNGVGGELHVVYTARCLTLQECGAMGIWG